MRKHRVESITLPLTSVATYVGYVVIGVVLGASLLYLLAQHVPRTYVVSVFSLSIYSGAVFAHFRFAQGTAGWRNLEFSDFIPTLCWSVVFIVIGSMAIGMVQAHANRILAGFDDAIAFRRMNAYFSAAVHEGRLGNTVLFLIDGCLIAPIGEELLFRSGLYRILKGKVSVLAAAGLSSAAFSAIHGSVSAFLPLLLLGYLCCWVYEKTADIRGPILFHAGYNLLVFVAAARAHV